MDDILIRLARAIASRPRLRILSWLAQDGATTPTALKRELELSLPSLSNHLKILSSVGLIRGRKSGVRCHYRFDSPYGEHTLSGAMARWLNGLLKKGAVSQSPSMVADRPTPSLHTAIFLAATAFTDLRRLQILRYLDRQGAATLETFVARLRMSPFAANRHTAKLRRRGLLLAEPVGKEQMFRLAPQSPMTVVAQMHEIVRRTWAQGKLRT